MADPTNPEDTTASFAALNETMRQFQDTLGSSLDSISTSMNAAARATTSREAAAIKREEASKKEADANRAMSEQVKRLQDAYGDAYEIQGKLNKQGKVEITQIEKSIAQKEKQDQLDKEMLEQIKKRKAIVGALTEAEEKAYLLEEKELIQKKKSQKLLEDELKQIGKKLDENGKIINIDKQLLVEDEKKLAQAKKQYKAEEENRQTLENVGESLKKLSSDFGKLALSSAFDFLKASVIGTYKAQVAYEDALIAGERGRSVEAAAINAKMLEMAGAMDSLGGGLVTLGTETVATGIKMALAGGPIGLLVIAVGALLAVFGYAAKVEAENMKRTAELKKKQAELFDTLFKDFGALGEASMGSSRGMTGLKDDLAKVGLSIKEFETLNKVLKANAKEMSMLGAGTVGGINNFLDVTGGLISSELGKTFREMGIDRDAMMEHTAKYMAQEQRFGLMQKKSVEDQARAAGAYVVELDKMATLTGATRKEQESAREAVMQIQSLRAAMMKAKASGNTEEAERLKRYLDVATAFQQQGMTEQAKGTVELAAGKGPTSQASAMVMQASPQMIEMLDKNIGTATERYAVGLKEFKAWAINFADAASVGADMSKIVGDYGKIDDANIKLEQLIELQKKNPEKSLDQLLVEMRKNKDPETEKQVKLEEENRKKALEVQERLLNGQELTSQQMTNATSGFWDGVRNFMDGVLKFMKAVAEFAKHPLDSIKEVFTGKDKSQRDAEELEEVSKRIEGLKKALGNPDEAKKLAEDNLALAKKEFDAKDKAVTDLNIAYNKEKDINKRKEIEQKQILAEDEREAARRKKVMAETAVTDAEKAKRDNNPEKIKKQLEGLETKKKELTEAVKTNEPSKTTPAARDAPATASSNTAPEAPKKELGGIVPGTSDGTTVTVGEKGKPEAILPLDAMYQQNAALIKAVNATNESVDKLNTTFNEKLTTLTTVSAKKESTASQNVDVDKKIKDLSAAVDTAAMGYIKISPPDQFANPENDQAAARIKRQGASSLGSFDAGSGEDWENKTPENDQAAARIKRQGAPKLAEGGVVPGTSTGTTVTVGEKGKPEAIVPLDMLKPGMLQNAEKSKDPNADAMLLLFKSLSSQTADAFAMFNRIVSEAESEKKNNTKEWQALPKDIQESITKSIADYKSTIPDIAKQIAGQNQLMNQIDSDPKLKVKDPETAMKNLLKMVDANDELAGIGNKQLEAAFKDLEQNKEFSKLTDLSNKLTEKQTSIIDDKLIKSINLEAETNGKLIISMNKVTEMLPTTVQKIIDAASSKTGTASSGAGSGGAGGSAAAPAGGGSAAAPASGSGPGGSASAPASGGGASPAGGSSGKPGESAMSKSGAAGEVQTGPSVNTGKEIHTGGTVSWRTNNPGNVSYGDLAKQYGAIGTWKNPDGDQQQRTTGIAIMPSIEDGDKLKMGLWKRPMYIDKTIDQGVAQWTGTTGLGSAYAKDLANAAGATMETKIRALSESQLMSMVTKQRQWEGFKPGKVEPVAAFDGGVFEPKPGGVHVNLAEAGLREAAVPLNPGEKIRVEKSEQENNPPKKEPLSTVMAPDTPASSNSNQSADILAALHELMESKFDSMISALRDGNDISDKILKYSQV